MVPLGLTRAGLAATALREWLLPLSRGKITVHVESSDAQLAVAVTGPTGTFGFGVVPLLESEPRIARIIGIARRPFGPAAHGWTKMEYRQGDVRDRRCTCCARRSCSGRTPPAPRVHYRSRWPGPGAGCSSSSTGFRLRRLQHRRRRRAYRGGRGPGAGPGPDPDPGQGRSRRGASGGNAAQAAVHRPPPIGSRRSAIRRSWTPPRPSRSSAGARDTPRSRPCGIR